MIEKSGNSERDLTKSISIVALKMNINDKKPEIQKQNNN